MVAIRPSNPATRRWWPLALAVGLGLVYVATLLPGPGYSGDSAKFGFVGALLGTGHPPGHPTYVLANFVFGNVLPVGSLAWRANLLSAVFAVATVVLLYLSARELDRRPAVAFAVAAAIGLTPLFWVHAVVAEVYTLVALASVGVVLLLLRWRRTGDRRLLYGALLAYGIAFGVHTMVVLLAPGILAFVWRTDRSVLVDPRVVGIAMLAALVGASQYGYLLWRSSDPAAPFLEIQVGSARELWQVVTGQKFQRRMLAVPMQGVFDERVRVLWETATRQYLFLLPLTVVGVWRLRRHPLGPALVLWLVAHVGFAATYDVDDWYVFLIPSVVLGGLAVAAGLGWVVDRVGTLVGDASAAMRRAGTTALLAVPIVFGIVNLDDADMSDHGVAASTSAVLETVPDGSVVFTDSYSMSAFLWYELHAGQAAGRPVYVASYRVDPETVHAYLTGDEPLELYEQRLVLAPGMPVYVMGADEAADLEYLGHDVQPIRVHDPRDAIDVIYHVEPGGPGDG